jgi:hypothetical protein
MIVVKHLTFLLAVLLSGYSYCQDIDTDFYDKIKNHDLSIILAADSILTEDRESSKDKIKRAAPLGFIGDNFQRFYIRFISIIQSPANPYEYLVYGKTMVKDNICVFHGKIVIKESRIHKSAEMPSYKEGVAICDVVLYEDRKQPSTGLIKGQLKTNFIIDDNGQFRYDALMFVADGFSNNQFKGTWTSYKTSASKKCHWGDYRIPDSGDLDVGTGEFAVSEKYIKNGWGGYMLKNNMTKTITGGLTGENVNEEWWWK